MQKAFSIIELLLVLTIFGVMLLLVVPCWYDLVSKNRTIAYVDEIQAALRFTRVSAILLGESVAFCGSKTHEKCDGSWRDDLIVITESKKVLRILSKITNGDRLKLHYSFGQNDRVVFLPTGFTYGQYDGSFHYCPKNNPKNALRVVFVPSGRTNISDRDVKCL